MGCAFYRYNNIYGWTQARNCHPYTSSGCWAYVITSFKFFLHTDRTLLDYRLYPGPCCEHTQTPSQHQKNTVDWTPNQKKNTKYNLVSNSLGWHPSSQELGQRKLHVGVIFNVEVKFLEIVRNPFGRAKVAYVLSVPMGFPREPPNFFVEWPVPSQLTNLEFQSTSKCLPWSLQRIAC